MKWKSHKSIIIGAIVVCIAVGSIIGASIYIGNRLGLSDTPLLLNAGFHTDREILSIRNKNTFDWKSALVTVNNRFILRFDYLPSGETRTFYLRDFAKSELRFNPYDFKVVTVKIQALNANNGEILFSPVWIP